MKQKALIFILAILSPALAWAGYKIDVTTTPNWDEGLELVAIVTQECGASVNCREVENQLKQEIGNLWRKHRGGAPGKPAIRVLPSVHVTNALMQSGLTGFDPEEQDELIEKLGVDALFVLKVPSGKKGRLYERGSESKLDLHVTDGERILLLGSGTGRAQATFTSPERVAAVIGEKILRKALTGR